MKHPLNPEAEIEIEDTSQAVGPTVEVDTGLKGCEFDEFVLTKLVCGNTRRTEKCVSGMRSL